MLDTETKRRIDTARDILVGKVPDPKSQVEQITIALIYKFMDDMDAEAEELGGKRKFFTGDFARYGWAKLMDRGLGGHEMLARYAEGITKMTENPGLPPLFREIFKNAFLPYRDPETLKAFLKTIDEFTYDHSERLGDAFEYLLSVLGSQGDAGQFRTPRHIIDFMVAVIDPQKTETVLDPACGTAGFLISSYKHILRANIETPLTPDERGRLAQNFKGYDISPDMVRLSLVNLYLHGFTDPHIYEYDSLTSEERWNEYADVILANPPFMSPKGGIKPHKRFSIQAKRSEVLFVDYMAEHLTPAGRAGIIVPEGIIFQSQTAYKDLRRMLVENYLVAVVSLPAGCFNPYSGVKTSILILDKALARQSQTIAFFKVENDGFGLGAQRRAIEKNDLPQVQAELKRYLHGLRTGQFSASQEKRFSASEDGQFSANHDGQRSASQDGQFSANHDDQRSASQERQFSASHDGQRSASQEGQFSASHDGQRSANGAPLSQPGATPQENAPQKVKGLKDRPNGNDRSGLQPSDDFPSKPGTLSQAGMDCAVGAQFIHGLIVPKEKIATNGDYNLSGERYRENGTSNSSFPMVELGEVITLQRGYDLPKQEWREGTNPIVGSNGIIGYHSEWKEVGPGVVTGRSGTIGKVHFIDAQHYWPHNTSLFVKDFKGNEPKFVKVLLEAIDLKSLGERTAAVPSLDRKNAHKVKVPLPPLEVQKEIVAEIEGYQKVINGARAVLDHYRPHIPIHPDWPMVRFEETPFEIIDGDRGTNYPKKEDFTPTGYCLFLNTKNVRSDGFDFSEMEFISKEKDESLRKGKLRRGDVVLTTRGTVGNTGFYDGTVEFDHIRINSGMLIFRPDATQLSGSFLHHFFQSDNFRRQKDAIISGSAQPQLPIRSLNDATIPLPPLDTQQAIVAEIEAEQALVAANHELIARFERKIQATLARIWGEEEAEAVAG